ncbi:MAG: MBL fold metallo-hydrolase [Saprospiraceae bacterium]|nr:MBL fold metallo-hydrolase [Saprospiraceae bacterium]
MTQVLVLEVNPFAENAYLVWDEDSRECVIVDPGMYTQAEQKRLVSAIKERELTPVRLLNTHAHLDHVFGNAFVYRTWGLRPEIHPLEEVILERYPEVCRMYGIPDAEPSPSAGALLQPGDVIRFGRSELRVLFTPGHSPGSISFYCESDAFVLGGDVLFWESIGRTDLPGGDFSTLAQSIRRELYALPGETVVFPGHGPATTIRHEMGNNPFVPFSGSHG